jgi:hypothetical protein
VKKTVYFFLLVFYSFGTICLPLGDFSVLADLPQMYHHCKTVEDKDMTPIEFVTDHLLNIDGVFDGHQHGDPQKPHQPLQHNHPSQTVCSFSTTYNIAHTEIIEKRIKPILYRTDVILSDYTAKIFRPPIQA